MTGPHLKTEGSAMAEGYPCWRHEVTNCGVCRKGEPRPGDRLYYDDPDRPANQDGKVP